MSKVAIVTDSNSGITQNQASELGISVIPMPFMINDEMYYEDITLTRSEFYSRLQDDSSISTSQPSPEAVMGIWDELLKDYNEIVHIPMSSGLSGSYETALMLSHDYDGKVQVVNNQRISVTQRQSVMDAINLASNGTCAAEIKDILEQDKFNSSIYIMLDTLYYLKKGGRITPAAAALGTLTATRRGAPAAQDPIGRRRESVRDSSANRARRQAGCWPPCRVLGRVGAGAPGTAPSGRSAVPADHAARRPPLAGSRPVAAVRPADADGR